MWLKILAFAIIIAKYTVFIISLYTINVCNTVIMGFYIMIIIMSSVTIIITSLASVEKPLIIVI